MILLVVFAFFQIPSSDDYCNKIQITKLGILPYVNDLYFNWTGRLLTSLVVSQLFALFPVKSFNYISIFNLLAFIGALTFIVKSWIESKHDVALLGLLTAIFLGSRAHVGQFIFWPTGGIVYSFSYFIFFLCLYFLRNPKIHFIFKLGCVFLGSSLIESINPAFLILLFVIFKEESNKKQALVLLAFAVASSLLFLAPGNFSRASSNGGVGLNLFTLIFNYCYVVYKSLRYIWGPGILAFVWGMIFYKCDGRLTTELQRWRWYLLIAAFASLSPFMLAPIYFNGRSSSFFVILISLSLFVFGNMFLQNRKLNFSPRLSSTILWFSTASLLVLVAIDVIQMQRIHTSFLERDLNLSRKLGQSVKVPALIEKFPLSAHFDDVKVNENHWINKCVATYYGLEMVQLDKK